MRITKESRLIVLNNVALIRFCHDNCIDMKKLAKCEVECYSKSYYMFMKTNPSKAKKDPKYLVIDDLGTRPDPVLIMKIENNDFIFETTDKTHLVSTAVVEKRQP